MRRTHITRNSPRRRQLAFEPLEPRELLAADTGFDWWSAADVPTDDWSWTFDDSSSFDTGDGAWGSDSWWVGDSPWDAPAATDSGAVDFGINDGTDPDAGWFDWSADAGNADAGWAGDVDAVIDAVTPTDPEDAGETTDEPVTTVVDVVSPPAPGLVAEELVETPGMKSPADPLEQVTDPAVPPAIAELDAEDAGEPPVVSLPPIVVPIDGDVIADVCDLAPVADETAAGVTPDAVALADESATVDATDDATDGSWVFEPSPADGLPSELEDDVAAADEDVVDVVADEPVLPPPIVIMTPIADQSSPPVPAPTVAEPAVAFESAPTTRVADRFSRWGAIFFQAFGSPAADANGSLAGGQATPGRPRLRLPFRPGA